MATSDVAVELADDLDEQINAPNIKPALTEPELAELGS